MDREQKTVNRPHGIMFHHFYDEQHVRGQGAISADQLERIIKHYGEQLISAKAWFDKAKQGELKDSDICITFDDALLCQYDVAVPVLQRHNLTAFWFVYSSVLTGGIENLEVYRKFRTECFKDVDDFYQQFFTAVEKSPYAAEVGQCMADYSHENWKHFPFYTENDTRFRYIRDTALGVEKYNHLMDLMMQEREIDLADFSSDLWMRAEHIQKLHNAGHVIGLHSHTHPTQMAALASDEQLAEYQANYDYLSSILGESPKTVSHPCNSYNEHTLSLLKGLNIELGFRANMEEHLYSEFEYPREDHANIVRRLAL